MLLPLYTSLLCRSTAKHLVVDMSSLLVSRSNSWKKEMGMELKKAKATWKLPSTCASVCPASDYKKTFGLMNAASILLSKMLCKFLF